MNLAAAIDRHRQPLLRIVAALYAMIGLTDGGTVERLSSPLYRAVLALLRPAEAAVRRLIIVAAREIVVKPFAARPAPAGLTIAGKGKGRLCFRLFDPCTDHYGVSGHSSTGGHKLRIRVLDVDFDPRIALFRLPVPPAPAPVAPDDSIDAAPLCRRLAAISRALKDLPCQARRYARWRAKAIAKHSPRLERMLRPGPLPRLGRKPSHEVHAILTECHWLARTVPVSDTS